MPAAGLGLVGWVVNVWHANDDEELEGSWYDVQGMTAMVVSYSQHQEGHHVVMYEENGGRQWEGWDLPDPELCFLKRSPQCQIVVTDDMLPTVAELSGE